MSKHKHRLSHYKLLTGDMGKLYPAGLIEVLPGDVFRHSSSVMIRLSPMAAPIMHPISVRVHHFFVPHRLAWPSGYATTWENFITGGPDGTESNALPQFISNEFIGDMVCDYHGLPNINGLSISSLPLRGYNLIFNEFFRDQDLVTVRGDEEEDVATIAWEKDYFTTARPWPQKGEEVTLPLGTRAPVTGIGTSTNTFAASDLVTYEAGGTGSTTYTSGTTIGEGQVGQVLHVEEDPNNVGQPNIFADLSKAAAAKVNDIRRAFALQRFAEVRARFGSRYSEYLAYLGVRSPDSRLGRPEFLGGGTSRVSVSEVLQTAPDDSGDVRYGVADMYGHGIASTRSNAYRKRFQEHGYVHTLISVRPKQMFTQGVEKTFLRKDREDFWQQELQFIGQQQVMQQELEATADEANKDVVFGWSDRYEEYRQQRSSVSGEFRDTLDYWHLARKFETPPVLNESFISCDPSKRIFNDQTTHALWVAVNHRLMARRLVSRVASGRLF